MALGLKLKETSGTISIDEYIVNFLEFDNVTSFKHVVENVGFERLQGRVDLILDCMSNEHESLQFNVRAFSKALTNYNEYRKEK